MPSFRTGTVTAIVSERPGLQRIHVDGEPAYVLTQLIGPVAVGDEVVINTTAVDRDLGSGGWHVVHWNLSRRSWSAPGPGHIMKLRYTSVQVDTGAAEEDHDIADDLGGVPVVVCTLHSQLPCVAVAFDHLRPGARIAYVMTDGAALPIALSDLVAAMSNAKLLVGSVTAGHAFGGDLEAVSVPSALVLARQVLEADLVIVAMGPGLVGTGSSLGTTALEAVGALDATAVLGGQRILAARASAFDPRARHRAISHHTVTVLRLARPGVTVPVPIGYGLELDAAQHHLEPTPTPDMDTLLRRRGVRVTTMGRGPSDDPVFFAAAGAAGIAAARYRGSRG